MLLLLQAQGAYGLSDFSSLSGSGQLRLFGSGNASEQAAFVWATLMWPARAV